MTKPKRSSDEPDRASRVLSGLLSLLSDARDEEIGLNESERLAATELRAALEEVKRDYSIEKERTCFEEALRRTRRSLESLERVRDRPAGAPDDEKGPFSNIVRGAEEVSRSLVDEHERRVRAAELRVEARSGLVFASHPSESLDDCMFDAIFDLDDDGYRFIVCTSP